MSHSDIPADKVIAICFWSTGSHILLITNEPYLERRPAQVPIRSLLVSISNPQQGGF